MTLSRTAAANALGFLVGALVAFVQAPFLLHALGDARYGTWVLVGMVSGYYGLLDFGVRGSVGYFLAVARARDDAEGIPALVASAVWTMAALAALVLAAALLALPLFQRLFAIPAADWADTRRALALTALTIALSLVLDVFAAVINGCRRADLLAGVDIATRLATTLAIFLVIPAGPSLTTLAAINLAGRSLGWLATIIGARQLERRWRLHPRALRRARVRDLFAYGSRSFVGNVGGTLVARLDSAVIGAFLGSARVTPYALAQSLVTYLAGALASVTLVLTPYFADAHGREDHARSRALFLGGTRATALLASLCAAGLLAFGTPFLRLWAGERFVSGPLAFRADVVLAVLLAATLPRLLLGVGQQYLFGSYQHGVVARLVLVEGLANVALSCALAPRFGLVGVALGTLLPTLAVRAVIVPRHLARALDIPVRRMLRDAIVPALPPAAALLGAALLLQRLVAVTSWPRLLLLAGAAGTVGLATAWAVVPSATERAALLARLRPRRAP